MFLSLVRPDRILSPITRSAATSLGAGALAVVMIACGRTQQRTDDTRRSKTQTDSSVVRPYPAIVGYAASSHPRAGNRKSRLAQECVVVCAVCREPVSAQKFPALAQFTGNFCRD